MGREVLESFTAQTLHRTYCWLQRDGRLEKSVHDQTSARYNLELQALQFIGLIRPWNCKGRWIDPSLEFQVVLYI